jgi:uncharacterized protein YjbI with pentapeptide repeats
VNKRLFAGYLILTTMTLRRLIVVALGLVLLVAVVFGIFWFGWDWKALIGWRALVDYINPKNATDRKDAVQVYALIVAGVVATITAAVGLLNLRLTRRSLEQQREIEFERAQHQSRLEYERAEQQRELAQGTALQAYYEQIGKLITEYDLRGTHREDIRQLARGQTLTVLQEVDGNGKGSLLTFLYGARLVGTENPAVVLTGANLREVVLRGANLTGVDLRNANLWKANLQGASLWRANLSGANLQRADLRKAILEGAELQEAYLQGAILQRANLEGALVTDKQLDAALSLQDAILPDGTKHR